MSTTVIASRAGLSFYLAPWAAGGVDLQALESVLHAHGLQLRSQAQPTLDFVVAEGLSLAKAQALKAELEDLHLHVSIQQRTELEWSPRTLGASLLNGLPLVLLYIALMPALLTDAPERYLWLLLALWPVANVAAIQVRNGNQMTRVSTAYAGRGPLSRALLEMKSEVPAHLFTDLWQQAEALETQAAQNPNGQAAQALHALAEDLNRQHEARVLDRVGQLTEQLEQVQLAVREAQQRPPTSTTR